MKIIDNYRNLPIGKYLEICELARDERVDALAQQVKTISILTDMTEDEVLTLPIMEYRDLASKTKYLEKVYDGSLMLAKSYKVGGFELIPVKDFTKMNTAQYIDFQNLSKEGDKYLVETLSTLLIPKGKKYNDGYEIAEVHKAIRENLSVADVLSLSAFFFDLVEQINKGFPNLFHRGDSEYSGQEFEGEIDEQDSGSSGFQDKWGWIANVDMVSETCRCSWNEVWQMSVIEFLNIICYKKDKAVKEKEEIEKFKKMH